MDIETISRGELKAKLDNGDDSKLVMTMNEWMFDAAHIPGPIQQPPRHTRVAPSTVTPSTSDHRP
jgi:hypothetical protein